jgi:hypothetical protein
VFPLACLKCHIEFNLLTSVHEIAADNRITPEDSNQTSTAPVDVAMKNINVGLMINSQYELTPRMIRSLMMRRVCLVVTQI